MIRTRQARTWVIVLTLICVASAFASSENSVAIAQKTVLNATLSRTAMSVEFDDALVSSQAAAARYAFEVDQAGALLAIQGVGTPVARVLNVELGDAVASALDASAWPSSIDDLVRVNEPVICHGVRLAGVGVSPVIATEDGLRAVRRVEFEVVTEGVGGANQVLLNRALPEAYASVLRRTVDNLDDLNPNIALGEPARYLVIGSTRLLNTDLANNAQYNAWLDLKRRRGYDMQIVTLSQIAQAHGDSSAGSIKNFIAATYNDQSLPPLVYGLILGDVTGAFAVSTHPMQNPEVPTESSVGDNFMFAVDGTDYISDIFHGRVSAQSVAEYAQYFRKVYLYEAQPFTDNMNWYRSMTCVAGNFADNGTYPVTPVWNMRWAREYVMEDGCITDADTFFFHDQTEDPSEWTEEIMNDINQGVCAVWYRGWGSSQCWQYPVLCNTDVESGVNVGQKFPSVWGIVCGSGNFAFGSGPCFGERWTTGLGTPTAPNGAITYVGASDLHTNTKHNNAMLAAMAQGMIIDGNRSTGALVLAGKLEVYRQYPLERADNEQVHFYGFHVFNVLGDPETPIYFCEPHDFNVNVPSTITRSTRWVNVTVTDDDTGQPVEGAVVGVRRGTGETSWTAMTNSAGQAAVPVNFAGLDLAQLTVWKHTYFMHWQDLSVATAERDPWIGSVNILDGDNLASPGESVQMTFDISNVGTQSATWTITATSLDTLTTVTNGNASTPEIVPNGMGVSTPITVQVASDVANGAVAALALTFNDGTNSITRDVRFSVSAPDPLILNLDIQDADGILSPGETANIGITIRNTGSIGANEITATVHSWDNAISFPDNSLNWANVNVGAEVSSATTFSASLPNNVTPGRQIALRVVFALNGQPFTWKQVFLTAGVVTPSVPTGPDDYGYYAYEDIDVGYAATPTYSWTELDPEFGGSGGTPHLVRDDTHVGILLPQPFTYYGESYDSLYICSNGWVSFGLATLPEFRNWEIPSPIGPPSMVCVFFDDLIANGDSIHPNDNMQHEVFTNWNGSNRFIIEWRALNRAGLVSGVPNRDFCTFQCVLEYNASGDGSLLFLYNQIANTDATNNYASVGIQDERHLRGLGLTFANTYIPSVAPLAAGRAIRFTTTPPDAYLDADDPRDDVVPTQFAMHAAYPNPFNPATELRFDLAQNAMTTLKVYDTLGREVATLVDGNMTAGAHSVRFDAAGLASGLYFARLVSGANTAVQKIVLMK